MSFFKDLNAQIGEDHQMILTIRSKNNVMSVCVNMAYLGEGKKDDTIPIVISGTPEDIDSGFIPAITIPVDEYKGLEVSSKSFVDKSKKKTEKKEEKKKEEKKEKPEIAAPSLFDERKAEIKAEEESKPDPVSAPSEAEPELKPFIIEDEEEEEDSFTDELDVDAPGPTPDQSQMFNEDNW